MTKQTTTPPAGKTWITVEFKTEDWETGDFDWDDANDSVVRIEEGPEVVDLLTQAADKFNDAYRSYPSSSPGSTGQLLSEGAELLAQAIKAIREAQ